MRHISVGNLSLFLYPWQKLEQDASEGDLFVCHLVREARALIDPDDFLPKLRGAFRFRSTYQSDIQRAADLGWYIIKFGHELNSSLHAKRVLWCIRTILIARSAESGNPVFAPRQLAEHIRLAPVRDLLINRRHPHDCAHSREALRQFLKYEVPLDASLENADRNAFLKRFANTFNKVALQTLRQDEDGRVGYVE